MQFRLHFFFIRLVLCIYITRLHGLINSEILTPSNYNISGIRIIPNSEEVTTNDNNEWNVTILAENTWQFIVILDNSWGFDPNSQSTIQITINSLSVGGLDTFDDILLGFTVTNSEYFSMWIPMDNVGQKNRIYPDCDKVSSPTQQFSIGDIKTLPDTNRDCDVAGGDCANWKTMRPKNAQFPDMFEYVGFPLTFILENDPIANKLIVSFKSALFSPSFIQKCGFLALPTNQGLQIYVGGNDPGHSFVITSFEIQYIDTSTDIPTTSATSQNTQSPTSRSTFHPTSNPIFQPTINPTPNPTPHPTVNPTSNPIFHPTINPTVNPTSNPIFHPTINPTPNPTPNPTANPTINPILHPTINPTSNPTINPASSLSESPTSDPSTTTIPTSLMPTIAPTTALPTTMTSVEPTPDPLTSPTTEIPTSNPIAIIATSTTLNSTSAISTTLSAENTTLQTTTTTSTSVATLFFTTSEIQRSQYPTVSTQHTPISDTILISVETVESTRFDYDAIRIPILCALLVGACALCSVIIIVLRKRCTAPKAEKYETAALAAKPARTQSEIEAIVFRGHRYNNTASSADIYHGKGSYDSLEQKEEKEESDMDIEIGSDPTDKMLSIIGEIYDQYDAVHVTRRGPSISNIDLDVSSGRGSGSDDDYAIVEKPNLHNFSTKSLRRHYNTTTTSILMDRDEEKLHVPISSEVTETHGYHEITNSEFGKLQNAIKHAETYSDFQKLENIIKGQQIPTANWNGKQFVIDPNSVQTY